MPFVESLDFGLVLLVGPVQDQELVLLGNQLPVRSEDVAVYGVEHFSEDRDVEELLYELLLGRRLQPVEVVAVVVGEVDRPEEYRQVASEHVPLEEVARLGDRRLGYVVFAVEIQPVERKRRLRALVKRRDGLVLHVVRRKPYADPDVLVLGVAVGDVLGFDLVGKLAEKPVDESSEEKRLAAPVLAALDVLVLAAHEREAPIEVEVERFLLVGHEVAHLQSVEPEFHVTCPPIRGRSTTP